ncbi:MAG: phage portal protein [bacterium]|nr:phage portal protein [bacterium]
MNILKAIKQHWVNYKSARSEKTMWTELAQWLGIDSSAGNAMNEATFYACRKVLSEAIGKMPLKLMQKNNVTGIRAAMEHPLYDVVNVRPNPYNTSSSFWGTAEDDRAVYGNAYIWIQVTEKGTRLWRLNPAAVEVWYDNNKIIAEQPDIYYIYYVGAHRYYFASEEIIHLKNFEVKEGIIGRPVIARLKDTIESNVKAQALQRKMNENGITPKMVLHYTGDLNEELEKRFAKTIQKYADSDYADEGVRTVIPLPIGAELKELSMKFTDAQFLELKQYTSMQIAAAFGIKPYQIGDYTKSSYASAEAQQLSFYVDTLLYIIKQYEEELSYKLLSDEERKNGYYFKFNVASILRADTQTQIASLSQAVNSFLYTPNEAREYLDKPALPGGDKLLGNGTSIPVEYTGAQYIDLKEGEINGKRRG